MAVLAGMSVLVLGIGCSARWSLRSLADEYYKENKRYGDYDGLHSKEFDDIGLSA